MIWMTWITRFAVITKLSIFTAEDTVGDPAFYQVRRSRHLVLELPIFFFFFFFFIFFTGPLTKKIQIVWQLFDKKITLFLQVFDSFFDKFVTTFCQLFWQVWQLFGIFLTTFWEFFENFLRTFWQLFENLFDFFLDCASQLWRQILWNKFHKRYASFTPNCTWSPNYSVLALLCFINCKLNGDYITFVRYGLAIKREDVLLSPKRRNSCKVRGNERKEILT
jgi:hypothetical protein